MKKTLVFLAVTSTFLYAEINNKLYKIIPKEKVSYTKAFKNDYEAVYLQNGQVVLYDAKNNLIFTGEVINTKGERLLYHERQAWKQQLEKEAFTNLSYDKLKAHSFEINYGQKHNRYSIVSFSSPTCPNCIALEKALQKHSVSLYIIPLTDEPTALKIISADSDKEAHSFYNLAKNKTVFQKQLSPSAKQEYKELLALAQKLQVRGTPTFFIYDKLEERFIKSFAGVNDSVFAFLDTLLSEGEQKR